MSGVDTSEEETKIALHYGTMRFSMFTVFSAVVGATLLFAFSEGARAFFAMPGGDVLKHAYAFACLLLCILFTLAELRITYLVSYYQDKAFKAPGSAFHEPCGHAVWSYVVALTMIAPYLFSAVFWCAVLTDGVFLPSSAAPGK